MDIFQLQKLKTGIKQLDRLLYGGLPFGGLVLISGKPSHCPGGNGYRIPDPGGGNRQAVNLPLCNYQTKNTERST